LRNHIVLVTGASGFIGRHLVAALSQHFSSIRVLVRDKDKFKETSNISTHEGNITEPATLDGLCDGVWAICHLAGYAHSDTSQDKTLNDPYTDPHWHITVDGAQNLMLLAARSGVKKFIFISTVKTMGEGSEECLNEQSPTHPESTYGQAKLAAENMVLKIGRLQHMHTCVLRLSMVYGRDNKGNLPKMAQAIAKHRFPALPRLNNRRSMVHIDDVIQAITLALQNPKARGQVYIVTDNQIYSTRAIYEALCQGLGLSFSRFGIPFFMLKTLAFAGDVITFLRQKPFIFNSSILRKLTGSAWYSSAKIQEELGFIPTRTLFDSIPEIIAQYQLQILRPNNNSPGNKAHAENSATKP